MLIVILSTFPEKGSQNIGDFLIADSIKLLVRDIIPMKIDITFQFLWRAADWNEVRDTIKMADFIFVPLAIRHYTEEKIFPYFHKIIESNIPFGVISCGTSVDFRNFGNNIFEQISARSKELIIKANSRAVFFTTRGVLSQYFCEELGLKNSKYVGDVAFYDPRFVDRKFPQTNNIHRIIISDPHRPKVYKSTLVLLIREVIKEFPSAQVELAIHGKNIIAEKVAEEEGIKCHKIYEKPENGLDLYDNYDLHIGFRIHGCVSMLKRRKPSYLLEQDGRGIDYGLSFPINISVTANDVAFYPNSLTNFIKSTLKRNMSKSLKVDDNCVHRIMSMIRQDRKEKFKRFISFESEIKRINAEYLSIIEKVIN